MIHKNAGELLADGLGKQRGRHGAVHTAGKAQQHGFLAHALPDQLNLLLRVAAHFPIACTAADVKKEAFDNLHPVFRVGHFGMELHAVKLLFRVRHGRDGAGIRAGDDAEPFGDLHHLVGMAHPAGVFFPHILEQRFFPAHPDIDQPVFPLGGRGDPAAQGVAHPLHAVANAQHRNTRFKNALGAAGRVFIQHAGRAAAEDDALGGQRLNLLQAGRIGQHLRINVRLAHPARDQLGILPAKIQNNDGFLLQIATPFPFFCALMRDKRPWRKRTRAPCREAERPFFFRFAFIIARNAPIGNPFFPCARQN